jgi:fucose permease
VTAESWLNNTTTNETRGQALSMYMLVQIFGLVTAQGLVNVSDVGGYLLFIIPSVLVSLSFAPILLSINPTPAFDRTKPMTLRQLYDTSPLGCVGMFLLGGAFAAQFGMASVFGTEAGLNTAQISVFISVFFAAALVVQFPIGWLSDRMDRRLLIVVLATIGVLGAILGMLVGNHFVLLLVSAALIGGVTNPLYALLLAYTNDYLEIEDMAAASGGLVFINGFGAIAGPLITGWLMSQFGPNAFFLIIGILLAGLVGYAAYRMTVRSAPSREDYNSYAPVYATATQLAVETALEESHANPVEEK